MLSFVGDALALASPSMRTCAGLASCAGFSFSCDASATVLLCRLPPLCTSGGNWTTHPLAHPVGGCFYALAGRMAGMKEQRAGPIIAAVVAIPMMLFVGYMASYYALLEPRSPWFVEPHYHIPNRAVRIALGPAHELDRLIRRSYWNAPLVPPPAPPAPTSAPPQI